MTSLDGDLCMFLCGELIIASVDGDLCIFGSLRVMADRADSTLTEGFGRKRSLRRVT